jgi:nucleoid DNA-binding protein/cell division septation protein DedD
MILQKYIIAALQHHPQIAIENLGIFETKHQPAQLSHDAQGNAVLLPPSKILNFIDNSLALNSNILVDEICKGLFISNLEAQQKISQYVGAIKNDLNNSGQIHLETFGTLYQHNDQITFEPTHDTAAIQNTFETLNIQPLQPTIPTPAPIYTEPEVIAAPAPIYTEPEVVPTPTPTYTEPEKKINNDSNEDAYSDDDDDEKPAAFNWGKVLKAAGFIIPILLLGFLIFTKKINIPYFSNNPKPITKPLIDSTNIVTQPTDTIHPEEQNTAIVTNTTTNDNTIIKDNINNTITNNTNSTTANNTTTNDNTDKGTYGTADKNLSYHVVVGAFEELSMANKYINQLKKQGYNAQIIGTNQYGWQQVAAASYSTLAEAKSALNTIKSVKNDAWIKH